jgi:hypothetical protein
MAEDVASNAASMKDGSTNGASKLSRPNGKRARTARSAAWNQDAASTTSGKNGKEKSDSPKETIEGADSGADNSRMPGSRIASATEAGAAADADAGSNAAAAAPTTNGDGGRHSNGRRGRAGTTNGVGHSNNHNSNGNGSGSGGGSHGAGGGAAGGREPSWTELKKKAGLMLEYISQAQADMARAERKELAKADEPPAREAVAANRRSRLVPHGATPATAAAARAADVVAAGMANELTTRRVKGHRDFTVEQHPAAAMLVDAEGR